MHGFQDIGQCVKSQQSLSNTLYRGQILKIADFDENSLILFCFDAIRHKKE